MRYVVKETKAYPGKNLEKSFKKIRSLTGIVNALNPPKYTIQVNMQNDTFKDGV